jgi:pimeloyl-ACP methyl ester carboxylesterase
MTTWVLLRGLTRESRHWGSFPQLFRENVPDAHPVTIDLPGNGRLNMLTSPTTVAEMTAFCRAELVNQGLSPPYSLLAMSLGAMVAVEWAGTHAEELAGCVLINTSLRPFSPFYRRLRLRSYSTLLNLLLRGGIDREWEDAILRLTSTRAAAGVEVLESWIAYRRDHPVSRANALRQLWAAARYRSRRDAPATPLLILTSDNDALVDTRCSKALAAAWKSSFAAHPSAGHDIPLDDGEWVVSRVVEWLDRSTPTPLGIAAEH